jgi:S-adenosylmethionine hydrolase
VEASYIISAAYSSFPKGTVHLIEIWNWIKKPTYCNAMERFLFIAADNGILSMLSQKLFSKNGCY